MLGARGAKVEPSRAGLPKVTRVTLRAALIACLVLLVGLLVPRAEAAVVGEPTVVAGGLEVPWEVLLLPDGRTLVTERPGRVRVIEANDVLRPEPAYSDPAAVKFLGMALHPNFASNRFVYLYVTYAQSQNPNASRVIRFVLDQNANLTSPETVFQGGIKSDGNHDGGRIAFGPDGKLYVTTGDVHDPALPQDLDSLNGKILRLEAPGGPGDGAAPADNPFNAAGESRLRRFVWSYGHRHPQGIDWDVCGRMWETEHGPSGEAYTGSIPNRGSRDEINRIDRGANYGWPVIVGDEARAGMRSPVVSSGDSTTWAPGGLAFGPDGRLYSPLLAGQRLLDFGIVGDFTTDRRELFGGAGGPGRLRDATAGRGFLWLTTSNSTTAADERVLRVPFDGAGPSPAALAACSTLPGGSGGADSNADVQTPVRISLKDALLRWSRRLRGVGLRGLARRGSLTLSRYGLPARALTIRLERRRRGRRPLVVAVARGNAATVVKLRLTKAGRETLRRRPQGLRLVLRATLRKAGGASSRRSRVVVVRAGRG